MSYTDTWTDGHGTVERITLLDTGHFSALERPNEFARIVARSV